MRYNPRIRNYYGYATKKIPAWKPKKINTFPRKSYRKKTTTNQTQGLTGTIINKPNKKYFIL